MFKKGDIVKHKRNGLLCKVGYVDSKSGQMELWAYNPKPTWYPRFGVTVGKIEDYELA